MIERIQRLFRNYIILLKNMFSMMVLRGAEYIVALISMPYLVRTLGPDRFGALIFMQSIIQYYNIAIDYGFNLTASRDIAKANKFYDISRIFSSVMCAKVILFTCCTFLTLLTFFLNSVFSVIYIDYKLFWAVFLNVIGTMIFPIWFFQGIQEMGYIAKCKLISIIITTLSIFLFVKSPQDYILAGFLQAVTMLVTGILSWIIIFLQYNEVFQRTNFYEIKRRFIEGWQIFISTLFVNLYTNSNLVFLRFFTSDYIVGLFGSALKLIDAIKGLIWPLCQAIYPFICKKFEIDKRGFFLFIKNLLKISSSIGFLITIGMIIGGEWIVHILYGPDYAGAVSVLHILSLIPMFVFFSIFAGSSLIAANEQKEYSKILMLGSALDVILVLVAIPTWGAYGLAFTMCSVEAFVAFKMFKAVITKSKGYRNDN